ncbi:hypothetical protein GA0111570_10999 [Raineyella antarctica]|uniref:Uncharacterized protein n=1 Tax=Raineyella antarctica TaxID=1577474 RepID=A0A1G6HFV7_9ACTN|nr:hypothetical protein [Raineyella antarctica]SDB93043.1 hypothetical protein GA0111570_10999 [Raineyella antarctica]
MIEFTWTGTVAESHLWARELHRFCESARTVGDLLDHRAELVPHPLPRGVFPAGSTDLDLLDQVLAARSRATLFADVLLEPREEIRELCAQIEFTDPGRVTGWDRDQAIIQLPAHVVRHGQIVDTVGFAADCLDTRQQEWDELREGWLTRLADHGWEPCSTAFLTAAMTGFLDIYQRQSAPRMDDVVLVEKLSDHPVVRQAIEELRPRNDQRHRHDQEHPLD